jgi:hypothetical protein
MPYKLNDPIYVAHSGFYLNKRGNIDSLALATVGFLRGLDTTTAKFCLYLLLKRDSPTLNTQVRLRPQIEVRKRMVPNVELSYRKAPTIDTNYRLPVQVVTNRRDKPLIEILIDNCE